MKLRQPSFLQNHYRTLETLRPEVSKEIVDSVDKILIPVDVVLYFELMENLKDLKDVKNTFSKGTK